MRLILLLAATVTLGACRSYDTSGLGDRQHEANYARVFQERLPAEVTVLNSRVVSYRPGTATADDYEFELLVPGAWVARTEKGLYLRKGEGEYVQKELNVRRSPARAWYAPKPLDQYDLYRDRTGAGRVHMLVQKEPEADGRQRVFISKH
jgi:hypothetical protein